MKELNFYQLAKKKMEFENIGVGNTALDLFEDCSADPYVQKTDPPHYQKGQIQVWDFIADQKLDYFKGNVVKYVCRAGSKSGESELDDLMKAKVYVEKAIELLALSD
jgi:hypothetical protein|tara:strand:- start:1084 stop:1404 length:321 start_codon:yes stop_codon:yes gene_type:complete